MKPLFIAIGALGLLLLALPTTMVLAIGMAPTLGAFFADKTPGRFLTKCVAGTNFAGVFPSLYFLWTTGHTLKTANAIVADLNTWLLMYCAGAMGWLLFLSLPGVVAVFRSLNATRRIYVLREQQKLLINEWGDNILPTLPTTDTAQDSDNAATKNMTAPAPN
ncbi:MAG: hypothetical protein O3C49_07835 [Proteobacteria bacterium]|nr:hypothetical protein [Pseudomonadota bacterium]MDA1324615.1 hypothetical protein [Pseudomonadota bacterium]